MSDSHAGSIAGKTPAKSTVKPHVKATPEGRHTLTPLITVDGATKFVEFAKKAFDAKESNIMPGAKPGLIGHAELKIGDSHIMLMDPMEGGSKAQPASLYVFVDDVDATYKRALQAGATQVKDGVADQFYGDRMGCVKDFAGNTWWIATHIEDVSADEMKKRYTAMMQKTQKH
jgi:PhnB protein